VGPYERRFSALCLLLTFRLSTTTDNKQSATKPKKMASPPYNHSILAMPPPFSPSDAFNQPRKRRQSEISSSSSTLPRTSSLLSDSRSHSKPPQYTGNLDRLIKGGRTSSRSPSVDGMSQVTGVSGASGGRRKRARKSRGKGDDDSSLVGGRARSGVSIGSGKGKKRAVKDTSLYEEEDEDDAGGPGMAVDMIVQTEEERKKDQAKKALFVQALDEQQTDRYAAWASAKLADASVRRVSASSMDLFATVDPIVARQRNTFSVRPCKCHSCNQIYHQGIHR